MVLHRCPSLLEWKSRWLHFNLRACDPETNINKQNSTSYSTGRGKHVNYLKVHDSTIRRLHKSGLSGKGFQEKLIFLCQINHAGQCAVALTREQLKTKVYFVKILTKNKRESTSPPLAREVVVEWWLVPVLQPQDLRTLQPLSLVF